MTLVVGFSGSRNGMTEAQSTMVWECLKRLRPEKLHHGDCVGADAQCHELALREGIEIYVHPPKNEKLRAFCQGGVVLESEDYLPRNRHIVNVVELLIAAPSTSSHDHWSGTWYTINYAKKRRKTTFIVLPDGSLPQQA